MKIQTLSYLALAILGLTLLIILFLLPIPHTDTFWLAAGFMILALLFQIPASQLANDGPASFRHLTYSFMSISCLYLFVQLGITALVMLFTGIPAWIICILSIAMLSTATISCILLQINRQHAAYTEQQMHSKEK